MFWPTLRFWPTSTLLRVMIPAFGGDDFGVAEIQLRLIEFRLHLLHDGRCLIGLGFLYRDLLRTSCRVLQSRLRLRYAVMRNAHSIAGPLQIRFCLGQRGLVCVGCGNGCIILLF